MGADDGFHAWHPGLSSGLPRSVRALATVFRPENTETDFRECEELSDLSGLPATKLCLFRAERLVIHEVLVRVMADLSIPMGAVYADLGVNFRRIVATILSDDIVLAQRPRLHRELQTIRDEADTLLREEIAALFRQLAAPTPSRPARSWRERLSFGLLASPQISTAASADPLDAALLRLDEPVGEPGSLRAAVREALRLVAGSLVARQGYLPRDEDLLRRLGVILVSNGYGSRRLGLLMEPAIDAVIAREGYRRVGAQAKPVVMSVKGASASGKSTIRPYQRALAERTGVDWRDVAIITPDVWRKFLLDYDSLGEARRYAGPLTGYEVEIVDEKLDLYMARKAAEGRISHLLIDRFRFDSFSVESRLDGSGQLLSRFGHTVYLQFMVTPPEETVERAWKRGQEFGRYKAVEDLLAHNVEAFSGIPRLFFQWALRRDKIVAFEFLDNTVPQGEVPLTIAYGRNDTMTVLDPVALLGIERFRKINVYAQAPEQVYAGVDLAPGSNCGFLTACIARLAEVSFAERDSGRVYARFARGRLVARDDALLSQLCADATNRAVCEAIGLLRTREESMDAAGLPPVSADLTLGSRGLPVQSGAYV